MSPDHLIIGAGTLAFVSNFKQAGGFPSNGIETISATALLTVLTAMTKDSAIGPAVSAFAALVLLVAVFKYVPGLYAPKKGKS